MKVNGIPTRTIRALDNGSAIEIIDQTLSLIHISVKA